MSSFLMPPVPDERMPMALTWSGSGVPGRSTSNNNDLVLYIAHTVQIRCFGFLGKKKSLAGRGLIGATCLAMPGLFFKTIQSLLFLIVTTKNIGDSDQFHDFKHRLVNTAKFDSTLTLFDGL